MWIKIMRGVQESLAGRVAVLSLTSLSQAEINGGQIEPFTVDMDALLLRKEEREEAQEQFEDEIERGMEIGKDFEKIYHKKLEIL